MKNNHRNYNESEELIFKLHAIDNTILNIKATEEVSNFGSMKCCADCEVLVNKLETIGCRVERNETKRDEFLVGEIDCLEINVWKPNKQTLEQLAKTLQEKEAQRRTQWECDHTEEIELYEKTIHREKQEKKRRREKFIEKLRAMPEITEEMKAIHVKLPTLYVKEEKEGEQQEVFLSPQVAWGTESEAVFRLLEYVDQKVLNALELVPYDGSEPGNNDYGAWLYRRVDMANEIARRAGWKIEFKAF